MKIGTLTVDINANSAGLDSGISSAGRTLQSFEKKVNVVIGRLAKLGIAAATTGATFGAIKLVNVTREFDKLNAGLITATGSAKNADIAFQAIQEFAATTPYALQDATDAFIKLVNLGLEPSERALRSYGNTSAAMGKDLNQFIEAVADASTAEFERLKEFGIRASNQGDTIAFTFRGVRTEVANNAREIEKYLIQLGENNFGDAMSERMKTLDGAMSNLGDAWDMLFLTISKQGVGDAIEENVRKAIESITDLNDSIASGQLQAQIAAIGGRFDQLGRDVSDAIDYIYEEFKYTFDGIGYIAGETGKFVSQAFQEFPENIRAMARIAGTEFLAFGDQAAAAGVFIVKALTVRLLALVDVAKAVGKAMFEQITNPFGDVSFKDQFEAEFAAIMENSNGLVEQYRQDAEARQRVSAEARKNIIVDTIDERDAALKSFEAKMAAADELRKKYDQAKKSGMGAGDALSGFGGGNDGAPQVDPKIITTLRDRFQTEKTLREQHRKDLQALDEVFNKGDYGTEEEFNNAKLQLEADFQAKLRDLKSSQSMPLGEEKARELRQLQERLSKISPVTSEGSELEQETARRMAVLQDRFSNERAALAGNVAADHELLLEALDTKQITLEEYNQRELDLKQYHEGELTRLEQEAADARKSIQQRERSEKLSAMQSMFSDLSTLMSTQSRKLFEIGKVASIANTIVSTYESAQNAFNWGVKIGGPPLGAAMAGAAVVAGMARVQAIQSTSFGSKGGAASSGGGVAASAGGAGSQNTGRNITIDLHGLDDGAFYSGATIRRLISGFNEAIADGAVLRTEAA